jgi:predicted amidohydrolase YtcJ
MRKLSKPGKGRGVYSLKLCAELFVAFTLTTCSLSAQPAQKADLIFKNGAVYTSNAVRSWADAVAIRDGKIIYVGPNSGIQQYVSYTTTVIDLQGKMLVPGFYDSHVHPVSSGMQLGDCALTNIATVPSLLEAIRRCKAKVTGKKWLVGSGWELPLFESGSPSKELLDQVAGEIPVFLESADGHSAWVNSKALVLAGVGKNTKEPERGRIERDQTGEPSGTLRESAMNLVARHIPPPTQNDYVEGLRRALRLANSFGITSVQDASSSTNALRAYKILDERGELTVRVVAASRISPDKTESQIAELIRLRSLYKTSRLNATAAKIFVDGVIESHTAFLLSPYLDRPGYRGAANYTPERLTKLVTELDRAGFQIHIHAIGDGAIRMSLDAFEAAQKSNGRNDARHHIAHLELISPSDLPRFAKLGIIANFQPLWAYADSYITDLTEPLLGPERSRGLYPIGSISRTGAVIVGGSDWSVTSLNPLEAIQVGITRYALDDVKRISWLPEERTDLPTMIAAYTINGAYLSHREKQTGSIEVGKAADLVVLSSNLFAIPVESIHKVKVLFTLLQGKEVFRHPDFH